VTQPTKSLQIEDFRGMAENATDVDPKYLQFFKVDQGSTHEIAGIWMPRRGFEPSHFVKKAGAIQAISGMITDDGVIAYELAEGTNLHDDQVEGVA